MIVDSSALVAIVKREQDWIELSNAIDGAKRLSMSAASYLETSIVIDFLRSPVQSARLDSLIDDLELAIEPVTAIQAKLARQAYRNFGRGSGHPANLNFGDCFSYALALDKREPLLFKGNDFVQTDLRSALQQR